MGKEVTYVRIPALLRKPYAGSACATAAKSNDTAADTGNAATAELSRANQQAALMQQMNAMQMQNANCCCETREAIQGVNYNLATQACDTRNTIQNATRDIVDNQNCNARAILDALTAQRIETKNEKISALEQQLFAAQLAASQQAQNNYLVNQLKPCPSPAYVVPNPNCCYGNPTITFGNSCGCCGNYAA